MFRIYYSNRFGCQKVDFNLVAGRLHKAETVFLIFGQRNKIGTAWKCGFTLDDRLCYFNRLYIRRKCCYTNNKNTASGILQ